MRAGVLHRLPVGEVLDVPAVIVHEGEEEPVRFLPASL
jgi:hypothetical protein